MIVGPGVGDALNDLRDEIHGVARYKGWWTSPRTEGELLMLIVSEAAEALEEIRAGHPPDEVYHGGDGKPEGFPIELADILIRVLDIAGAYDIDIGRAVIEKMRYNRTRPYRHGGKAL